MRALLEDQLRHMGTRRKEENTGRKFSSCICINVQRKQKTTFRVTFISRLGFEFYIVFNMKNNTFYSYFYHNVFFIQHSSRRFRFLYDIQCIENILGYCSVLLGMFGTSTSGQGVGSRTQAADQVSGYSLYTETAEVGVCTTMQQIMSLYNRELQWWHFQYRGCFNRTQYPCFSSTRKGCLDMRVTSGFSCILNMVYNTLVPLPNVREPKL